jgi:hypothetical protein
MALAHWLSSEMKLLENNVGHVGEKELIMEIGGLSVIYLTLCF